MARSAPRKSTKKCPRNKHGRRAHMRGGKRVKATCVKNRRKMTLKKSKGGNMRRAVVAMFYPDRAPVTIADLMNMYSKSRFLQAVNEPIEPSERAERGFKPDQSFEEIVERLMTFGGATIDVTPDKRPFPEGQSRIVFMNA